MGSAKGVSTGGIILGVAIILLVCLLIKGDMEDKKTSPGYGRVMGRRLMSSRLASSKLAAKPQFVQNYVGQGPPAPGYAAVGTTYSGEWEASAESPYEKGPSILPYRLSTLQTFNNVKASGGALAPPVRLKGSSGGVAFVDGVDIPMPILRHESAADTGFHGKSFDESTSLLTGVV